MVQMEIKSNKQNEMSKKTEVNKRVSNTLISEVVECSPVTVKKVLNGARSQDTNLGQSIMIADMLLEEGMNKLINEVKRVVKF